MLNSLPLLDIIDFCARFRHCLAEPRLASFARPALLVVNLTSRDYPNIHMRHDERGRMPAFSGGQSVCLLAISLSVYALENTPSPELPPFSLPESKRICIPTQIPRIGWAAAMRS